MNFKAILLAAALVPFTSACTRSSAPAPATPATTAPAVESKAVVVAMTPLTSDSAKLEFAKSKATLVNIWATWCGPCKEEMPELVKIQKDYSAKGARVLLVSADSPEDQKKAIDYLKTVGGDFSNYVLADEPTKFMNAFDPSWSATLPTTMLFDQTGQRKKMWVGRLKMDEVKKEIEALLK